MHNFIIAKIILDTCFPISNRQERLIQLLVLQRHPIPIVFAKNMLFCQSTEPADILRVVYQIAQFCLKIIYRLALEHNPTIFDHFAVLFDIADYHAVALDHGFQRTLTKALQFPKAVHNDSIP